MKLPEGVFDRPRQEHLIAMDEWAVVRIDTGKGRFPHNKRYKIKPRTFEDAIAPYLHGDWEEFDRFFNINPYRKIYIEGQPHESPVLYSSAIHTGDPKLPNITVVPNLSTLESRGLGRPLWVFGSTMGHYHPAEPFGYRIQEVYEFQSYGMMLLDKENGEVEMWVAQDGDKIAIPTECHMTLYNLADKDNPLIALNFSDPDRNESNKNLIREWGPILLAFYDDFEVFFTLNRNYINNPKHSAGVRLDIPLKEDRERQVRIARGARLNLGRLLYEQLTQNPDLIGQFARLGIRVKQASPEAVLEPLQRDQGSGLYFSLPLVQAAQRGTDVYRYFIPQSEAATPTSTFPSLDLLVSDLGDQKEGQEPPPRPLMLDRPLVILVEGVGDWVEQTYRPLFYKKITQENKKLSVFYADDTRWKKRPSWAKATPPGTTGSSAADAVNSPDMQPWETYLDKADPDDFAKYQKLRPDVAFIVTPDFTHSTIARNWLNKIPTIFIEKPFDSQVKNVEELRRNINYPNRTDILGLDHYQFYALPIYELKRAIDRHLGGALAKVLFYMTEGRPIEHDRVMSLQYGLTLDLLPHLTALLTYFGDVSTIDEIRVIEAGQYQPLVASQRDRSQPRLIHEEFHNETFSRVQFTFQDSSGNGFHIPCTAIVGKGFAQDVKYLEITGLSGNAIRVDLRQKPTGDQNNDYPWDSLFFLQGEKPSEFPNTQVRLVSDPYHPNSTLRILYDPEYPNKFSRRLERSRYEKLLDDLLDGTSDAVISTLSLKEGQDIVSALDRTWWAIQASRSSWVDYKLHEQEAFQMVGKGEQYGPAGRKDPRRRAKIDQGLNLLLPIRTLGTIPVSAGEIETHRGATSVRTRGPINANQETATVGLDIGTLLGKLRKDVQEMPLTILVHGWGSLSAQEFLTVLSLSLQNDDALWLVPASEHGTEVQGSGSEETISTTPRAIEGAVMLNLERDTDQRIYANVISDLVFFPGLEDNESVRVTSLTNLARAVLVDSRNPHSNAIVQVGNHTLTFYKWSGKYTVSQYHKGEVAEDLVAQDKRLEPDLNEIGKTLKEMAQQLEREPDSRVEFRARILKVLDTYPGRKTLNEDLVRQADSHGWPGWAVESMPQLFIPIESPTGTQGKALVWHFILQCVPEDYPYEIKAELCAKQFLEIEMGEETANFLEFIAPFFEENLRLIPHADPGSQSIIAVNEAMLDVEREIDLREPKAAHFFKEKRKKLIEEILKTRSSTT